MNEQPAISTETGKPNTKEALLDSAEALFGDRGYEAVGIREIVERANANLAAIKYHFGSKRDLYNETVRRLLERARADGNIWDLLNGPFQDQNHAATALGSFIGLHCLRVLEGGASSLAARLFLMEGIWPSEAFQDVINEHFKPCMKKLEGVIRAINPSITEQEAVMLANSVMAPMAYQRVYRKIIDSMAEEKQPIETHAQVLGNSIASFVIRGIGANDGMLQAAVEAAHDAIRGVTKRSD